MRPAHGRRLVRSIVVVGALATAITLSSSPAVSGQDAPGPTTTSTETPTRDFASGDEVTVAVRKLPPFVEKNGDRYTGFTADLWEDVAKRIEVRTRFVEVDSVNEQLDAVRNGDADVAATAISITSEREKALDFSLPYFDAGLQIMIPASHDVSLGASVRSLFTPSLLLLLGFFLLALVFVGAIVSLIERRKNPEFAHHGVKAFGEGMWWAIVTVATVGYGDRVTRTTTGRIIAAVWIMFGLVFVAHFTATVTANLTVRELQTDIRSPLDLAGKKVVTVGGTTAARYLRSHEIPFREVGTVQEMANEVAERRAEAAVYDAPVLAYQAQRLGSSRVALVGAPFTKEYYGLAFPPGSPLVERVDRALLQLAEDGTYERLSREWFPPPS